MLTLPTPPELESRLKQEAVRRGLEAPEYAVRLLAESLSKEADELDVLLDAAMGAFAHVSFSSEDLHHERRTEREREERRNQERFNGHKSNEGRSS